MPTIRVILADDHAVVRAGIRQFLEQAGDIEVVAEADDGLIAKKLIDNLQPDVAILDIQMPKVTGIEVTRWLRVNHQNIGVLILSAYDDDPYVNAVLQAGANGYVLKTASPEEMIQAVRDVHSGKSALDRVIVDKMISQMTAGIGSTPIETLTDREAEVLTLVGKGFTNKAIAFRLEISDRTVQGHLAHIFQKLNVYSRTEAVMKAISLGWLPANLTRIE